MSSYRSEGKMTDSMAMSTYVLVIAVRKVEPSSANLIISRRMVVCVKLNMISTVPFRLIGMAERMSMPSHLKTGISYSKGSS